MRLHWTGLLTAMVVSVVGVGAVSAQSRPKRGVRAAVEAANKKFSDAAAKGDAAAIARIYTTDAMAFPPNSDIVHGRADIEKLWQSLLASGISSLELVTTEVESQGNLAYEVGTYELKTKAGPIADRGKYCVVWKRVNGQWMLHRDIWSTNMPEAKK